MYNTDFSDCVLHSTTSDTAVCLAKQSWNCRFCSNTDCVRNHHSARFHPQPRSVSCSPITCYTVFLLSSHGVVASDYSDCVLHPHPRSVSCSPISQSCAALVCFRALALTVREQKGTEDGTRPNPMEGERSRRSWVLFENV